MQHSGTWCKCGFSARGTKTLSESTCIFLCESFTVHAEVIHTCKSENGFMNSACNRLYRERERERDCARENRRVEREGMTLLRSVEEKWGGMKDKKEQNYKNRDKASVNECLAGH